MTEHHNHDGHRDRVREKIKISGIEAFHDHEILEYMLFSLIPRKDVNDLAHDLINTFNGFAGVLDASYDELREVKNMTDNAALYLSTLPDIFVRYQISKDQEQPFLTNKKQIISYAKKRIGNSPTEIFLLICLDVKRRVLRCKQYTSESRTVVRLLPSELAAEAVKCGAYYVATAHNHPSGDASPSLADIALTNELKAAFDTLGINYIDNVIVARKGDVSFAAASKKSTDGVKNDEFNPNMPTFDFAPFDSLLNSDDPDDN